MNTSTSPIFLKYAKVRSAGATIYVALGSGTKYHLLTLGAGIAACGWRMQARIQDYADRPTCQRCNRYSAEFTVLTPEEVAFVIDPAKVTDLSYGISDAFREAHWRLPARFQPGAPAESQ